MRADKRAKKKNPEARKGSTHTQHHPPPRPHTRTHTPTHTPTPTPPIAPAPTTTPPQSYPVKHGLVDVAVVAADRGREHVVREVPGVDERNRVRAHLPKERAHLLADQARLAAAQIAVLQVVREHLRPQMDPHPKVSVPPCAQPVVRPLTRRGHVPAPPSRARRGLPGASGPGSAPGARCAGPARRCGSFGRGCGGSAHWTRYRSGANDVEKSA